MSSSPQSQRVRLGDYLTYGVYRLIESAIRLMPMEVVCVAGVCLGQLGYGLMRKRRKTVIRNLRIVHGHSLNHRAIKSLAQKTFRASGLNFIASVRASTLGSKELNERVRVEGIDHLQEAHQQGNGCILLLAHMGNWEILTQMRSLSPEIESILPESHPMASLYRPLDNPLLDRLVKRRRTRSGTQLFSRKDSFAKPISLLKSGGMLGAIADQHAGIHGLAVPLFGKLTSMTSLPALLHRKTKAPIIPVSMKTVGLGKWLVTFHPFVPISEEEKKNTHLVTSRCALAYEHVMATSPSDVLWMHGYWKVGRQFPLRLDGGHKKGPEGWKASDSSSNRMKPFHILVYLADLDASNSDISDQLDYLKNVRPDVRLTITGDHPYHPSANHVIQSCPDEPPHLLSNAIIQYDLTLETPIDCAIDLSPRSTGSTVLDRTGIAPIFAPQGKHQNRNTRKACEKLGNLSPSQFLQNLCKPL